MTTTAQTQERRRDPQEIVDAVVEQRKKTFEAYCVLGGVATPAQATEGLKADITPLALKDFLNLMVDYTATGQFTLYQRIIEGKERRGAVREIADKIYPSIGETTDALVEFNDKYEGYDGASDDQQALREDLSRLGEVLAIRGELEDEILQAMISR